MTPIEAIARLEADEKAMISKPWIADGADLVLPDCDDEIVMSADFGFVADKANASGIALLRNAAPALIACARALEEVLDKYGCMGIGRDALANLVTAVRNQHPA